MSFSLRKNKNKPFTGWTTIQPWLLSSSATMTHTPFFITVCIFIDLIKVLILKVKNVITASAFLQNGNTKKLYKNLLSPPRSTSHLPYNKAIQSTLNIYIWMWYRLHNDSQSVSLPLKGSTKLSAWLLCMPHTRMLWDLGQLSARFLRGSTTALTQSHTGKNINQSCEWY